MKLAFSIFLTMILTLSSKTHARDIVLIENLSSKEEGEIVKKILNQKYKIPLELISLKHLEQSCSTKSEAVIHICIDESGELKVAKMNKYVVKNALSVFRKNFEDPEK
jgi:ribulose bisphosphate carboxylase small subunit